MKQDDYLLNQIDLLGKVLAKIIAQLLKRKTNNEIFEVSEVTIQISEKEARVINQYIANVKSSVRYKKCLAQNLKHKN